MMILPDIRRWFFVVRGDDTRAWSTEATAWVAEWPHDKVTSVSSLSELSAALRTNGLAAAVPEMVDYQSAIQAHVDATAVARGYDSGTSLAGYVNSAVPSWAAEAATFIAWRDAVWVYVYQEMAKVQGGQRAQPSPVVLDAELPTIEWPA